DAPILYCMYLDKPMRDHTLLQAIARVNRPCQDEDGVKKPAGFVLDFVGIFEKLEKALAFDSDTVASVIQNLDVLKERFATLMAAEAPTYLALCESPIDDKAVERAIDAFADKEQRERFYKFFTDTETLYEIISPNPFLRPHLDNYRKLSVLYQIVRNAFSQRPVLYEAIARKTESLVRDLIRAYPVSTSMPVVKIDEKTLEALRKADGSGPAKVINLGRSLIQSVNEKGEQQPYLVPIGERAEAILESYDDRQIGTQEALKQLERLVTEHAQATSEREQMGFDLNTFTIYWVLKQAGASEPERAASLIDAAVGRFPNYRYNAAYLRRLKAELYKVLLPVVGKDRMVELVEQILRLQRRS
ncbi:MAG: type I restriction endonuclease subunit R, partial [candidate division NC10 bacterium]|nr:type I restriction endonuclease subunit R [candidate division NC10 bacterium]